MPIEKSHKNILMLQEVANGLRDYVDEVVFVGGATTILYINDKAAPESLPSDDVDLVVEVTTTGAFAEVEEKLRKLGFKDWIPSENETGVICRKLFGGITVDVMPSSVDILGFSNRWYPVAVKEKIPVILPNKQRIYIFSVPYFIASKLVAFNNRGGKDMRFSQDMEDILSVIDGNLDVVSEVLNGPDAPKKFIRESFARLIKKRDLLEETASGFILRSGEPPGRINKVMATIEKLSSMD